MQLRQIALAVSLFLASAVAPVAGQNVPASGDVGVFVPLEAGGSALTGLGARMLTADARAIRARRVTIDFEAFVPLTDVLERGGVLPALRLNLFQDVVITSLVESVALTASGYSWSGGVAGDPMGSVAVAINGDVVSGVVRTQGREYLIQREGAGQYSIREVDRSGLPEGAPPRGPRSLRDYVPAPAAFVDDPSRVDIAVFYTPAARQDAGGTDEIHAVIDAWIADTNGAYWRSDIHHRLNLVLREEIDYTEGEDSEDNPTVEQALDCLYGRDDGCLDHIHDRRQEYSADLVHLLVSNSVPAYPRVCGIARLPGSFGVSHLDCGSATFAHEIGHNSGVNHDRYVEYDEACETDSETPCFSDLPSAYAYGYVNQLGLNTGAPLERRWRTLMSYANQCIEVEMSCPQAMRFSNSAQSWFGDALGVSGTTGRSSYRDAADAARRGPADAARMHREFAHDLANRVVRTAPDLTIKGLRVNPLQAGPGAVVRLGAIVENLGISTGSAPETEVTWCRMSASDHCSSEVGVPVSVPPLESTERVSVSTSFMLPTARGPYVYRACVSAAPGEMLIENNCSGTVTVDVGVVDLEFSMSLSTYSIEADEEVVIKAVVRNRGTLPAHANWLGFYALDNEWERIGWHSFQTLRAGSSMEFETTFEAPSVAGTYRYGTCLLSSHLDWPPRCPYETLTVISSSSPGASWSALGLGATILELPTHIRRIRIEGEYSGFGENFIVWCGPPEDRGGLLVNEILGTSGIAIGTRYAGVHSALRAYGGRGEPCRELSIEHSFGVQWRITQVDSNSASFGSDAVPRGRSLLGDVRAVAEKRQIVERAR